MFSQRMVENFFKRTKFRRSRRLRSSFRSSLIKKNLKEPVHIESATAETTGNANDSKSGVTDVTSHLSMSATELGRSPPRPTSANSPPSKQRLTERNAAAGGRSPRLKEQEQEHGSTNGSRSPDLKLHQTGNAQVHSGSILSVMSSHAGPAVTDSNGIAVLKLEIETLKKELARSRDAVTKVHEREKLLRDRLSEQAQKHLEKGTSKFEDITLGDNRPSQLVKRYGNLYSEARLDAMDALDDLTEMVDCDDLKVKLLLSVIVLAFRSAQKSLDETRLKVRELLHIPSILSGGSAGMIHLTQELEDTIALFLRKTVEKHDVTRNYEDVCERVWATLYDYPSLRDCPGLLKYIDDCVCLAWALTLQTPQLLIDYESKTFHADTHTRFHTSNPDDGDIKNVLWPMLTEGEGGPCVYRGVVIT